MCNWHLVLPTFISHRWAYPDKIHSRCRKITAINKKARVTGINKRNYHNLYKGAPQELTKCLKLTEHKTRGQKCWALMSLSLICCAKLSRPLCSFMFQLFSHETGLLAFSSGEGETLRPVWKCLNETRKHASCFVGCTLKAKISRLKIQLFEDLYGKSVIYIWPSSLRLSKLKPHAALFQLFFRAGLSCRQKPTENYLLVGL